MGSILSSINFMIGRRKTRSMGYRDRLSGAIDLDTGGHRTAILVRTGSPDPSMRTIVRGRQTSMGGPTDLDPWSV